MVSYTACALVETVNGQAGVIKQSKVDRRKLLPVKAIKTWKEGIEVRTLPFILFVLFKTNFMSTLSSYTVMYIRTYIGISPKLYISYIRTGVKKPRLPGEGACS